MFLPQNINKTGKPFNIIMFLDKFENTVKFLKVSYNLQFYNLVFDKSPEGFPA